VDLESSPTLGLKLVKSFVDQLHGRLVVDRNPGTAVTVSLPEKGD
jgi:two-component sensor histidine kinase